jgi:hypothetical protein
MLERFKWMLKIVCLVLAVLLVFQLTQVWMRLNPLAHITIPEMPSLPAQAANQSGPKPPSPIIAQALVAKVTNISPALTSTNAIRSSVTNVTNASAQKTSNVTETNLAIPATPATSGANFPSLVAGDSRYIDVPQPPSSTVPATNTPSPLPVTNAVASSNSIAKVAPAATPRTPNAVASPGNFNPNQRRMMGMMGMNATPLPPAMQAQVDRVVESEILGPFIRPQPAALVGIAGNFAFVRAPTGQTGLIKEGDELGGIKLLRIGTNRVLVEEQGQTKELTIFSGTGGESLLPKQQTSHETNN